MKVIVSVDDNNGMMFNNRRLSSDINLIKYIINLVKNENLFMNEYSYKLFMGLKCENIILDNDFLNLAQNEFCFVEDKPISHNMHNIDVVYICKWNRLYPSDMKLDININNFFKLISTTDILGNSHKKITIEEWVKK